MSSNKNPCGKCKWYDPLMGPRGKQNPVGWCSIRSVYPMYEIGGRKFPDGVKRMDDPTKPSKPVIVYQDRVEAHCPSFKAKG